MRKYKKKSFIYISILISIVILLSIVFIFNINKIKGIEGNDWNLQIFDTVNNSKAYLENFDKTITLYLSGLLTDDAFSNELDILYKQWKIVKSEYIDFLNNNTIEPNSDTVASANGYTALSNYYKEIDLLFNELFDNTITKNTVSYIYLAHQQKIINYYASYYLSYNIIIGTFDNVSEYETTGILD